MLSVAAGRAYLDAGSEDGLAPGQRLDLVRRGAGAGACTVDAVAPHAASCTSAEARVGDSAALPRGAAPPAEPVAARLPPPVPPAEEARRREALAAAPAAQVAFTPRPAAESARELRGVEASLVHVSFLGAGAGPLHEERLEARVHGADLGGGWRLFLDGSAVARPRASDERYRTGTSAWVEVRELQAASREPDRAFAVAIGRVLPWSAPGATPFDGAQVGWRSAGAEAGLFGGAVPDVLTTSPTARRATAGAYGAIERGGEASLARGEGRLAMVRSPELGTRLEAEALGHAWLARAVDLSAQARLGLGGDRTAPAALDAARLDLTARVAPRLSVAGSLRYVGLLVEPDLGAPALFPGPSRHAEASVGWDAASFLTLRVLGGAARDLQSGLERGYAGPELALPRLFGPRGGVSAGWLEERGWASGRSAWLQGQGDVAGLRLVVRGSFFHDVRAEAAGGGESTLGLLASLSRDLLPWLRLRVAASGRVGLAASEASSAPWGASLLAGLDGSY